MNEKRHIVFLLFIFGFLNINLLAQELSQLIKELPGSGETVEIQADRSLYLVNEKIFVAVSCQIDVSGLESLLSSVVYVELIRWNGGKIAQAKFLNNHSQAKGYLSIPGDLESGVYYLRAYTKWMRNFSPYNYAYLPVKIVNPSSPETEKRPNDETASFNYKNKKGDSIPNVVSFSGLKESYGKREKVEFEISSGTSIEPGTYTLSVARKGTIDPSFRPYVPEGEIVSQEIIKNYLLPEPRGLSISGRALNRETQSPLAGMEVSLSSTLKPIYHTSTKTDEDGVFLFTIPPLDGEHEFILTDDQQENEMAELLIDSDFCNHKVTLPYIPFKVDSDEREVLKEILLDAQISNRFSEFSTDQEEEMVIPFYGKATRIIYEKDYIELESLGEFIFELVYEVTVRDDADGKKLYMTGQSTLNSYPALVMVDNIPISNIEEFLKIVCRRIDRLEIVKRNYIVGEKMYGGILSVYSEAHNMAGLKPAENSIFFKIPLLESKGFVSPNYEDREGTCLRIPDRRTTLFWLPEFEISEKEPRKVSFFTSDGQGEYSLILRKINGQPGPESYIESSFEVR